MTILAVDDEIPILELLKYNLQKEGFNVILADCGTKAITLATVKLPDLILLDLMLPDMSGIEVCKELKKQETTATIPIIMVTAKTEDTDIVTGLETGADDYITKPFSPKVLVARIKNILKRVSPQGNQNNLPITEIHGLWMNPNKFEVTYNNKPIIFSATEFAILQHLARNSGIVFSRIQIINAIKGESYPVTERSIDVQILSIRKKLVEVGNAETGNLIETVRGVGYRFKE